MTIYVDFDGVLCDYSNILPGYRMGQPIPGAVEAMQRLAPNNHLVIFTVRAVSRESVKAVEDWLRYFNVPHHGITNIKGNADIYLDDKAMRFDNWQNVLTTLSDPRIYEV